MRRSLSFCILHSAFCILFVGLARGENKDAAAGDELKVKNAFGATDGPSLVAFLGARGQASPARLSELIEALDSKDAAARHKASAELVAIGPPAVPMLRLAARDIDSPESAAQARRCLKILEDDPGAITSAVVRLLAARRPAGTAEALLAYLPHAENDGVAEELRNALAAVAYDKGKPDPALLKALGDEHPLRRSSAIVALCSNGVAEPRATLRKLLQDPMPSVRLRASLALAQAHDAKAVSTLITLLSDLPEAQGREVEAFLVELAGEQAPKVQLGADDASRQRARDAWAKWWLESERPTLLDEVKKRTLTEIDTNHALALIEKLGDDSFDARQKAEDELRKLGPRIVPLLKQAQRHADLEVRNRAAKCLAAIEGEKVAPLSPVIARLVALRKPKGAVEALLAYLPFAEEDVLAAELQSALNATAYPGGKAHPALLKALDDKSPVRRAAAAQALCSGPSAEHLPRVRRLLADKDPTVRLHAALALAGAREPEAVPHLIQLVAELPPEGSAMAEEYLMRLARDEPPKGLAEGDENRKRRADVWDKWWRENRTKVAMLDRYSPSRERDLGFTLLIQTNHNLLVEWDKEKKVRWQMTGLNQPMDAQVLPGNRVLVVEQNPPRVTERNLKGDILWSASIPFWPKSVERLSNGQTFVACQGALVTLDRGGRQVSKIDRPGNDIMAARRLRNGQIVMVTNMRQLVRLDRSGKEVKSAPMTNQYMTMYEILNNGHVLGTLQWNNLVVEYDADGKEVWRATVNQPMHAVRLANGNTLVSSQNWPLRVYELDKKGAQVGDYPTNNHQVYRMRRR